MEITLQALRHLIGRCLTVRLRDHNIAVPLVEAGSVLAHRGFTARLDSIEDGLYSGAHILLAGRGSIRRIKALFPEGHGYLRAVALTKDQGLKRQPSERSTSACRG